MLNLLEQLDTARSCRRRQRPASRSLLALLSEAFSSRSVRRLSQLLCAEGCPLTRALAPAEEISTFFPGSTLWQSFVCAIVAAVTLQYIDPFNTGKLALFAVTASQVWRGFELVPWLLLGVAGGIWGAWFIRINDEWELIRRASGLRDWPVAEVGVLALFTAVVSYLVVFMRVPSAELVVALFQDCSGPDAYGLCECVLLARRRGQRRDAVEADVVLLARSSSNTSSIVFLLLLTAFAKTLLTAATFGASIPAGVFLPSLTVGACAGRAVGLVMGALHKAHPASWVFADCPADGGCINPSVYAVIGAASALGGVTRMTISLVRLFRLALAHRVTEVQADDALDLCAQVVILFELTGAIDIVIQLMMAGSSRALSLSLCAAWNSFLTSTSLCAQSWSPSSRATTSPRTASTRVRRLPLASPPR